MNGNIIYFRDILLVRFYRCTNNCGQHALEKNIYSQCEFPRTFNCFTLMKGLNFVIFFMNKKIKRVNSEDLFSQQPLFIFTKSANIRN